MEEAQIHCRVCGRGNHSIGGDYNSHSRGETQQVQGQGWREYQACRSGMYYIISFHQIYLYLDRDIPFRSV